MGDADLDVEKTEARIHYFLFLLFSFNNSQTQIYYTPVKERFHFLLHFF